MAAAVTARRHGLDVLVIDDQPSPGGQIWRSIEAASTPDHDKVLGPTYVAGRSAAQTFRRCGVRYEPGTQLWQIEPGYKVFVTKNGVARALEARTVVLAAGAMERPVPFPGWTLPGVMTVGAAQIFLKGARQIPIDPVWVVGCGPLPLLYLTQLVRAGGKIAGFLDTTPPGQWRAAVRHLPGALRATSDLLKGLAWQRMLRKAKVETVKHVVDVEAIGVDRVQALRYRTADGSETTSPANVVLVHEGVVPNVYAALSLKCDVEWNDVQDSFRPTLDAWGESSKEDLFIAGDGAGIAGAKAAELRGELAALRIASRLGRLSEESLGRDARPVRRKLQRELAVRPFLDAMFRPRRQIFQPADDTIVCRCEEITAREVRTMGALGNPGPNQLKSFTRAGMGACQGRQCGASITRILAAAQGRTPEEVGTLSIRPPLKPVTLGELASLDA